jgi:hypothetical protein
MVRTSELLRAAEGLGLAVRDGAASGTIDGRRVSLGFELTGSREGMTAVVRGWLDPRLDLGLDMHRRAAAPLVEPEPVTGNTDLDGEFSITGDEPARVRELLDPPLCAHLVALHRAAHDLRLRDAGCSFFGLYGLYDADEGWVERAVAAAAATVGLMDEARSRVRPAAPIAPHAAALRAFAGARGLGHADTPLRVRGSVEGRSIEVGATRTGRGRHHLHARAGFEAELGIGLRIHRQGILDALRTLLGGQDILVGDAAFDARFLIRADPERAGRVAALFDAGARAALLEVDARVGAVAVDERGVSVDPIPVDVDPGDVVRVIDTLTEVTGRVARNMVHGAEAAGPYR